MSRSIYNNDKSQKNRSYIHIFFDEDIARLLVNPCYGYSRLLQATVDNCRSIYTARIYMQICRHADGKKWAIPYPDLRLSTHPRRKGVQNPSSVSAPTQSRGTMSSVVASSTSHAMSCSLWCKIIRQTIISPMPKSSQAIAIPRQAILFLTYTRHISTLTRTIFPKLCILVRV